MTKEELKMKSPLAFEFCESLDETEQFLTWERIHQDIFIGIVEAAHEMAKSETSIEEFRKTRDRFAAEKLSGDTAWIIDITDAVLEYVETMRKNA